MSNRVRQFAFYIFPLLLWLSLALARPALVNLSCGHTPESCTKENLSASDRVSVGLNEIQADHLSTLSQNASGILACLLPLLTYGVISLRRRKITRSTVLSLMSDLGYLASTALWNGALTELTRLISQRPRPFVYTNPSTLGFNPASYNSFVSGHTSFTIAMATASLILAVKHSAPRSLVLSVGILGQMLITLTAVCRVISGRHFLTDVLGSILLGFIAAVGVDYFSKKYGSITHSAEGAFNWRVQMKLETSDFRRSEF